MMFDQSANDNDYLLPSETFNRSYLNKGEVQKRDSDFIVLHSFCASNADELTLEKDDVVSVIQNRSSGWSWVTSVFVGTGWFPTSYLKPLDRSTNTVNKDQLVQSVQNDSAHSLSSDKLNLANFKDDKRTPEFIVLHSFCASNADELTLEKDDVVSVIQNRSSGWSWVTSVYVGTGWFPTSYLKPLDHSSNMLNKPDEEHSDEDDHEYLQVNEEPDEDGLPQKSEYVYARPSEIQEIKNKGHYEEYNAIACRANHSYESSNKNELSFEENQTILVLEETECGWWRGSTYFGEGWFPATYVKVPAEGQDEKTVDKDYTESQSIKQQDSHYEDMNQLSKQNRIPNCSESWEDVSPYLVTDLMSSNTHQFSEILHHPSPESSLESTEPKNNPKKSAKGKRRRRPPPIPTVKKESNSEQEVNSSATINEAEEGVVILSNPDQLGCALSKLIRITKRLSTTNPAQSNFGPPPDRPVPIPPPRKPRKTLSSADHNKEKQRAQRPQIIPRNVKKKITENIRLPNDVPKRPPPPTPDKLKEYRRNNLSNVSPVAHETFTDKHWSKTKQKRPQRHSSTNNAENVDLKKCESDINGNNTSTKDCVDVVYPGTTGNDFMKKNKGLPHSTVGKPIEEQKIRASPKPRRRKHTQSNEKEDYEIQPSLNDKNILENSQGCVKIRQPSVDLSFEPSSLAMKLTEKNLNKEEMSAHVTEVTGKSQFPAKQSSSGNSDAKDTTSEIERTPTCEVAPSTPPKNKPEVRKRDRQEQVLTQAPEVPPKHSLAKDNLTSMKLEHEMGRSINVEETATQLPEARPRSLCKSEENLPTTPTKDREMNLEYTRTNISKDMPRQQSTTEQKDRVTNIECRTATSPDVLPRLSLDNQPQPVQEKSLDQERLEDKFNNRPKPKPRTKKQESVN